MRPADRRTVRRAHPRWKGWIAPFLLLIFFFLPFQVHLLAASSSPGSRAAIPTPPESSKKPLTPAPSTKPLFTQKVNINTASQDQLEALPGIGPAKAKAIIAGRPYQRVEDLKRVKGIKEGTYNKIKDFITVQ